MKRICIVCPRLCHGGAERVAVSLANGFASRGHDVSFFADLFEEQTYTLDPKVKIHSLVAVQNPKSKKWWSAIWILRKYVKNVRPDVLIGIMPLCSIIAKIAAIGTQIPVIATEHNAFERPNAVKFSLFEKFYKFQLTKLFNKVTVLTEADRIILGTKKNNVIVMPNPLVIEPVNEIPEKKKFILAAGRVDNWHVKGFDVLIRAFSKLVQRSKFKVQCEGWKLVIAGVWRNPETRTYLDGIAKECGVLNKIEYTGFVEDMQKLYAESSIFVLSSRYEGFGLVLIEAMSQGCACIACDYKGRQREIMNPTPPLPEGEGENLTPTLPRREGAFEACETGILCEPDDVESLAAGIQKMIEDDEYRESVRAKAIERSKYYSIENTMDRWETLLGR